MAIARFLAVKDVHRFELERILVELRKLVYLAGPISNGGTLPVEGRRENMVRACRPAVDLLKLGFAVIVPQTTHIVDDVCPGEVDQPTWVESCLPQVAACDAVLRLPGESNGADRETAFALSRGIPVYTSISDLVEDFEASPAQAPRAGFLEQAIEITRGARQITYGHPLDNHGTTADLWSAWLRRRFGDGPIELIAEDVCTLNILQKLSREAGVHCADNWVDTAGYTRNVEMIKRERGRRRVVEERNLA